MFPFVQIEHAPPVFFSYIIYCGVVAQLIEHLIYTEGVGLQNSPPLLFKFNSLFLGFGRAPELESRGRL